MAMDRRRRLQDALDRQAELKKLKNFNFEDWRQRYLRWMSHKKARVMDFFRKLDLDRDGKLSRKEFSDGIINSKFPTNQLEMNAVADIFDRDGDGYVDYKEFIAALWPEKESGHSTAHPLTDAQKIEDEVKRQCNLCTCAKKFRVQRIAETKYRFGDSQQMRLVRILRSTVMVRVGGGWLALDEFLVKNDPCRAKGRTNVELREQFILAEGVSQSMTPFQSSRSRRSRSPSESSTGSAGSRSLSGPLIKIKEKRRVTRPWQEGATSTTTRSTTRTSPRTTTYSSTAGARNGDATVRKTTTRETHSAPGMGMGRSSAGFSTSADVVGQYSTVDVHTKPSGSGGGVRGEVTVRTVREEERTVSRPTPSQSVYSRLSASNTKKTTTTSSSTKTSPKPKSGVWR
jgi:dystonin